MSSFDITQLRQFTQPVFRHAGNWFELLQYFYTDFAWHNYLTVARYNCSGLIDLSEFKYLVVLQHAWLILTSALGDLLHCQFDLTRLEVRNEDVRTALQLG